jgi:hypothetical protein
VNGAGSGMTLPASPSSSLRPARFRRGAGAGRLLWLFLLSRQIGVVAAILAGCASVLNLAGRMDWFRGEGPLVQQVPVLIEAAVAAVIAASTGSPFGENEMANGRLLTCLRFAVTLVLTGAAIGVLAVASVGAHLPGGTSAMTRSVAGLTGVGLVSATALGGARAWVGPVAYAAVTEYALTATWQTPWIWAARPPTDRGAGICAGLVFVVGLLLIGIRGPRTGRE